ncbi:MAG: electron transfer flavoprotein subunit beta/FixA family protein [Bacteroidota bacterium]
MKILVCISEVPDTTTKIKFTNDNKELDKTGIQWIINPWDELSLTRAIELKEASNGKIENITVVNVGTKNSEPTIRKALAMGADNAIRIDAEPKEAFFVAQQIAEVVKNNNFDVILAGLDSADYNGSAVGNMIAEFLDMTSISAVSALNIENDKVFVNRDIDGGTEKLEVQTPFIAVVQKGIAIDPRIPAMRGIMMARTKPLEVVAPADSEILTEYIDYEMPQPKGACRKFDEESIKELVDVLHNEAKLI